MAEEKLRYKSGIIGSYDTFVLRNFWSAKTLMLFILILIGKGQSLIKVYIINQFENKTISQKKRDGLAITLLLTENNPILQNLPLNILHFIEPLLDNKIYNTTISEIEKYFLKQTTKFGSFLLVRLC
jgi:hypothetical protein